MRVVSFSIILSVMILAFEVFVIMETSDMLFDNNVN